MRQKKQNQQTDILYNAQNEAKPISGITGQDGGYLQLPPTGWAAATGRAGEGFGEGGTSYSLCFNLNHDDLGVLCEDLLGSTLMMYVLFCYTSIFKN